MMDIVLAGNLPKLAGMDSLVAASALKNFRQCKDAGSARGASKQKGALIYSPLYEFDDGIFVDLARSGGAIVLSFSDVLKERGFRRAIVLSKMRLCLAACRRVECGAVVCTLAKNEGELRNARELAAFMAVLGMNDVERKAAEKDLGRLASP